MYEIKHCRVISTLMVYVSSVLHCKYGEAYQVACCNLGALSLQIFSATSGMNMYCLFNHSAHDHKTWERKEVRSAHGTIALMAPRI
jgi:hypothetical protein